MSDEQNTTLIWNGEFELLRVKEDLYDEVLEFHFNNFLENEPICKALNFASNDQIKQKKRARAMRYLEEQVSFAVRQCATKQLVAVSINRMIKATDFDGEYQCGSPGEFVSRLKKSYNLFQEWNINTAMGIILLSTRSDFYGRGLATILVQHTIDFARKMLNGTLTELSILPVPIRDIRPEAVCSIFSSKFTQKLGEKLGMKTLARIPYTKLFYEGEMFSAKIDPVHECATYAAIKL